MDDLVDCLSPNFDERDQPVSMAVLHYTGMESGKEPFDVESGNCVLESTTVLPRGGSRALAVRSRTGKAATRPSSQLPTSATMCKPAMRSIRKRSIVGILFISRDVLSRCCRKSFRTACVR